MQYPIQGSKEIHFTFYKSLVHLINPPSSKGFMTMNNLSSYYQIFLILSTSTFLLWLSTSLWVTCAPDEIFISSASTWDHEFIKGNQNFFKSNLQHKKKSYRCIEQLLNESDQFNLKNDHDEIEEDENEKRNESLEINFIKGNEKLGSRTNLISKSKYKNDNHNNHVNLKPKKGVIPKLGEILINFLKWIGKKFFNRNNDKKGNSNNSSSTTEGKNFLQEAEKLGFELLNEPKVTILDVIDTAIDGAPATSSFMIGMYKSRFSKNLELMLDKTAALMGTTRDEFRGKFGSYKSFYHLIQDQKNHPDLEGYVLIPTMNYLKQTLTFVIKFKWGGCDQKKILKTLDSMTQGLRKSRLSGLDKIEKSVVD
ncbi:hypothetical protein CROQUDRAFT_130512 [Cronartium quercuum f. sp. fusiforme G11]|uniref:Uncharacterized protein n=1 Tax=Cronartium quercuum f. sp. fusiforme G11 TaxID=708437 RepID=A0A9P6NPC1_9BASI|nr:hypothetical protein CROQUDRAFT_130512 [Cronartium quercuum f. sp. fusiforme G11]